MTKEAVTTVTAGRVEYVAIRQHGSRALVVAWRYRVSRAGRWFPCGALVLDGGSFVVQGWDGGAIGMAATVLEGIETVKRHYSLLAIGSAEPARRLPY